MTGTLHEDKYTFWSYLGQFLEWKMFQTEVAENIKTQIL